MKFTKENLTGKNLEELKVIAAEMGIKPGRMTETELMYEILDKSAIDNTSDTPEQPKKKRGRPKKSDSEKTASKTKTKESTSEDPVKTDSQEIPETPKKKRGRPKKVKAEEETSEKLVEMAEEKNADVNEMPVVNENSTAEENEPDAVEEIEQRPKITVGPDVDFIIIDDIPKEDNIPVKEEIQKTVVPTISKDLVAPQSGFDFKDVIKAEGVLEIIDGYGFLRSSDYNYLSSPDDIFVNPSQVKNYGLKTGDVVEGSIRPPHDNEKFFTLTSIDKINGCDSSVVRDRMGFEFLTPLFPDEKFRLCSGSGDSISSRVVDLFAPIGKGQRALIVAQPKTGKTLLMKDIANSIARNHPEAYLMMLLIDERPEEVTDMARTVNAEVIASTFDAPAENHVKIANLVLEKAKRMVECGHDVVIFLDSITRLARAYNTVSPASGKVLTGGVDANALQKPKRFFGAARNIEGGGSLTIIATALIDTGSKMDEVIFEEFKGTGNMELQLDRSLSNKRIFPSVNLVASSTRRDDLLQDENTRKRMWILRKYISDMNVIESMNVVMENMQSTRNNDEFLASMNS